MFHKKQKAVTSEECHDGVSIKSESNSNKVIKGLRSRLRRSLGRSNKRSEPAPLDMHSTPPEEAQVAACEKMSAFATPDLYDGAIHAEALEASSNTTSIGTDVVASPEGYASSENGEDGQAIISTVEERYHVTKRRSAPALIRGGSSPTNSAISDATLVNSPRRTSPLNSKTPFHAKDEHVVTISSSSQQDLSSTISGTLCKVDEKVSRYHKLVEQLQADLAEERENAQRDRGVAQQALGEAQYDITNLEAEVSDLQDQLEAEKQNSQNHLDDYRRCDRDATAVIISCQERISELEADLNLEQRKARHNYSKAEEFMGLAESWRDAFHQLGHDPEALWKMLVEELRVRGVVFDYCGRLHRVGLRKALDAEGVDQWVPGWGDRSRLTEEVNEGDDHEITMDAMTKTGDTVVIEQFERNAQRETNMGQSEVSSEDTIAGEKQTEAKASEERIAEKDGHFDLNDVVDANRISEQTRSWTTSRSYGPEPLMDVNIGEAVLHDQRHGVCQGRDTADLMVGDQKDFNLLEVGEEAHVENIVSNDDLVDVSNQNERGSTDWFSQKDGTNDTDADRYETVPQMQSVKDCKIGAAKWSSEPNIASWEISFRLLHPQTSSLGLRHALPLPTMGNGLLRSMFWSNGRL